jgi:glyceraldehyde-3-phosphate dehydrogenase (NAD(P)+) (phosphorylating)
MAEDLIRVGVNGYGVIGKRVADAVIRQEDMELVSVSGGRRHPGCGERLMSA